MSGDSQLPSRITNWTGDIYKDMELMMGEMTGGRHKCWCMSETDKRNFRHTPRVFDPKYDEEHEKSRLRLVMKMCDDIISEEDFWLYKQHLEVLEYPDEHLDREEWCDCPFPIDESEDEIDWDNPESDIIRDRCSCCPLTPDQEEEVQEWKRPVEQREELEELHYEILPLLMREIRYTYIQKAVRVIENKWLECKWSPRTKIGRKLINKLYDDNGLE